MGSIPLLKNYGIYQAAIYTIDYSGLIIVKSYFENYVEKFGYPDLIHIHSIITAGQFAVYAKKKYNIPFVVTEHSSGFDRNLYSKRELMSFKAEVTESSHNFAVSKSLAEVLAKSIGGTWDVLPNWVK